MLHLLAALTALVAIYVAISHARMREFRTWSTSAGNYTLATKMSAIVMLFLFLGNMALAEMLIGQTLTGVWPMLMATWGLIVGILMFLALVIAFQAWRFATACYASKREQDELRSKSSHS